MSDLHARVLAELDRLDRHRLTTLGKVVDAVFKLHAPSLPEQGTLPGGERFCTGCPGPAWTPCPCSTIRAIARELGVNEGDDRG